jgi:hypothetical protein
MSITKVVVFFTSNPTKLSLKFSEFSMIFYAFYKFLQTRYTIEVTVLHWSPWKTFQIYTQALGSRKTPWKELVACNWFLMHGCWRRWPQFRCSGARIGRGGRRMARGSPRIGLRVWSGWRCYRRWRAAAATGTGRRASCFGEFTAGAREWVAWEAVADARGATLL